MEEITRRTIDGESERKKKEGAMTRPLRELHDQHGGKITDTWSLYVDELDKVLSMFRDKQIAILEIGVQNGGSLEIWSEYFPKAQKIVGVDIDPKCGELHFADPRVSVVVCDATSEEGKGRVLQQAPAFDVIIDDGSHKSVDIVRAFSRYFPVLKEDGLYIVEDLHTNYWADYEGGLHNPLSAMAFFRRLADITNYEHWRNNLPREYLLREFSAKYEVPFENLDLARIHSVGFANSLCIIGKSAPDNNVLGKRIIVGADEHVTSGSKMANRTLIHDNPVNIEDDTRLDVFELIKSGDELREQLGKKEQAVQQLQACLAERDGQIVSLNQGIAERDGQVAAILSSKSWRLTKPMRLFVDTIKGVRHLLSDPKSTYRRLRWRTRLLLERLPGGSFIAQAWLAARRYKATWWEKRSADVPFALATLARDRSSTLFADWHRRITLSGKVRVEDIDLPRITVTVVLHNSKKWLNTFVESLLGMDYPLDKVTVIFVDNESTDDTAEHLHDLIAEHGSCFNRIELIKCPNVGYGAGNHAAILKSDDDFVLVTNAEIRLIGSFAQGTETGLSDVDIFILLTESAEKHPIERMKPYYYFFSDKLEVALDLIVAVRDELDHFKNILRGSLPLGR